MKITICDTCPCRNVDYERGEHCNLGYNTFFYRRGGEVVTGSPACGLEIVKYASTDHGGRRLYVPVKTRISRDGPNADPSPSRG